MIPQYNFMYRCFRGDYLLYWYLFGVSEATLESHTNIGMLVTNRNCTRIVHRTTIEHLFHLILDCRVGPTTQLNDDRLIGVVDECEGRRYRKYLGVGNLVQLNRCKDITVLVEPLNSWLNSIHIYVAGPVGLTLCKYGHSHLLLCCILFGILTGLLIINLELNISLLLVH